MSSSPPRATREFLHEWKRIADELGLELQGPRLVGTVDGVTVTADVRWWTFQEDGGAVQSRLRYVAIVAEVPAFGFRGLFIRRQGMVDTLGEFLGGPQDVSTGDAQLDRALWIRASAPYDAALQLRNPSVLRALRPLATATALTISGGQVRLEEHSWDADRRIHQAVVAARALAETRNEVLEAAAEALGLEARRQRIRGEVHGVAIEVRAEATATGDYEVRVGWPGVHGIRPRTPDDRGGLGDPILDALLAFDAADPEQALAIYGRDAIRGPLLELVHGRQGEVRHGWLVTTATHDPEELARVCLDALALAGHVAEAGAC